MERRTFLKLSATLSLATGVLGCGIAKAKTSEKPNIIYVMLDDAGYGDFGAFGSKHIKTPAFDAMCKEGTKFTDHYSGSCVCAPTRCVLMTGLDTGHCRRRGNRVRANEDKADNPKRGLIDLKAEDVTVAEVLKRAGYVTGGIGKWGIGNPGSAGEPEKQGFDYWYGYLDQVHAHDHFADHIWEAGKMIDVPENKDGKKGAYLHDKFEAKTFEFIRKYQQQPFFLYLAYTLPHGKYEIPHDDPIYQDYKDLPFSQQVKNYAAMIARADQTVGRMMELLKKLNLDDNTIVFYTSDNGPNQPFVEPLDSAGGLRGIKRRLYEGGLRAPMVVRWPGKVPASKTSDFVWDMRDLFPTACELAGVETPKNLDGISVLPTLLGKKQKSREHLYWEFYDPFQQAVRMGKFKGIRFGTKEPMELYDLNVDVAEQNNIAKDHRKIVRKMEGIMVESHVDTPFWPTLEHPKPEREKKKKK
jgi:arylsulfatase A-like enzyme